MIRTINNSIAFCARVPIKVCQVPDKVSIYSAMSAAKHTKSDNMILGLSLFEGDKWNPSGQTEINKSAIDYIKELAKNFSTPVKIACVTNIKHAQDLITQLQKMGNRIFDVFQLHTVMTLEDMQKIKSAYPNSKILAKIAVSPEASIEELEAKALKYAQDKSIDGILLDSYAPSTGSLINWNVAKLIIDKVHKKTSKPVGIAGGISPKNAKDALEQTGADLLDANTGFKFSKEEWIGTEPIPKNPFAIMDVLNISKKFNTDFEL